MALKDNDSHSSNGASLLPNTGGLTLAVGKSFSWAQISLAVTSISWFCFFSNNSHSRVSKYSCYISPSCSLLQANLPQFLQPVIIRHSLWWPLHSWSLQEVLKFVYFLHQMYCQKLVIILLRCSKLLWSPVKSLLLFLCKWDLYCHNKDNVSFFRRHSTGVKEEWVNGSCSIWAWCVVKGAGAAAKHRRGEVNSAWKHLGEQFKELTRWRGWELSREMETILQTWASMREHGSPVPHPQPPRYSSFQFLSSGFLWLCFPHWLFFLSCQGLNILCSLFS